MSIYMSHHKKVIRIFYAIFADGIYKNKQVQPPPPAIIVLLYCARNKMAHEKSTP